MRGKIKEIDAFVEEGRTKEYKVPCEICGKIQIRYINTKKALCFKHARERRKERRKGK